MKVFDCKNPSPKAPIKRTIDEKKSMDDLIFGKKQASRNHKEKIILSILDSYDCFTNQDKGSLLSTMKSSGVIDYSLSNIKTKIKEYADKYYNAKNAE